MIKHLWTIVCRHSVVDERSKTLTLSDIIEELTIDLKIDKNDVNMDRFNIPVEFDVVSFWLKNNDNSNVNFQGNCIIDFTDPNGKILHTFEEPLSMPPDMKRLRTILRVNGLPITVTGQYMFLVHVLEKKTKGKVLVGEFPIEVKVNKTTVTPTK